MRLEKTKNVKISPTIAGDVYCYAANHGQRLQPGGSTFIGRAGQVSDRVVRPLVFPTDAVYRCEVMPRAWFDHLFSPSAGKFEDVFPEAADDPYAMFVAHWLRHSALKYITDAEHLSEGEVIDLLDSQGIEFESSLDLRYHKGRLAFSYVSNSEFFGVGDIEPNALVDSFMVLPRKEIVELAIHMLDAHGVKHDLRQKASGLNLDGNILISKRI